MLAPDSVIQEYYRITYVIDEQPDCVMYRALDQRDSHSVLIAALPQASNEALRSTEFLARQIASLQHTTLLRLHDHFGLDTTFYMVADDPGGQDLERVAREHGDKLTESEVLHQIERLLQALEALQSHNPALFLGDLRSTDIWASPDGNLHLAPFVLVRPVGREPSPYRAPELSNPDNEPTISSDLYILGAVTYQLLTGWPPPTADLREAGTPLNAPRTLNPQLSGLAEQMVLRSLEMKPANRYQIAREMRRALDNARLMAGSSLDIERPLRMPELAEISSPPLPPPLPFTVESPDQAPAISGHAGKRSEHDTGPLPPAPPVLATIPAAGSDISATAQPSGYGSQQGAASRQNNTYLIIAVSILATLAFGLCIVLSIFVWSLATRGTMPLLGVLQPQSVGQFAAITATSERSAPSPEATTVPTPTPVPMMPAFDPNAILPENVATITETRQFTETTPGPVLFSDNGNLMAVGFGTTIQLRDGTTLEPTRTLEGHRGVIITLAFSPINNTIPLILASGAIDEATIRVWDTETGDQVRELSGHSGWIRSVAFSPDGTLIASGSTDQTIKLWDATNGNLVHTLEGHSDWVSSVAFSPDSTRLASTSRDGAVSLWDVANGTALSSFSFEAPLNPETAALHWTTGVTFSPDGSLLAVGTTDNDVFILDAASGEIEQTLAGHTNVIVFRGLAFSPDGKSLASASLDGTVRLWDPRTGAERSILERKGLQALSISWSPDSTRLAISSNDSGEVLVWDIAADVIVQSIRLGQGLAVNLAYSPDGRILGAGGVNGTVRLHMLDQQRQVTLTGGAPAVQYLVFLNNTNMAVVNDTGSVSILNLAQRQATQPLSGHNGLILSVAVNPARSLLAGGNDVGEIALWEAQSRRLSRILTGLDEAILRMAFSGDGSRLIAVAGANRPQIGVWNVQNGELIYTINAQTDPITGIAVPANGQIFVSASQDGTLRFWDLEDGSVIQSIDATPRQNWFSSLAFSPDGSLLVTGDLDGDLEFRNVRTGKVIHSFASKYGSILSITFSADGKQLAISSSDGDIRVLEVPSFITKDSV
ncbi:MAG: WD40 repeat domain-containing serine/threonine-protein kinase [Chloroflexales bacterium]|nr:WD40 repeat domain-containing serine/threonine-protein kinase [Chloroflexales bacterium]